MVYINRPMENTHKFKPPNKYLNNNTHKRLSLHCDITVYLTDIEVRKFSVNTPNTIVQGIWMIHRRGGNIPSLLMVYQDCYITLYEFGVVRIVFHPSIQTGKEIMQQREILNSEVK